VGSDGPGDASEDWEMSAHIKINQKSPLQIHASPLRFKHSSSKFAAMTVEKCDKYKPPPPQISAVWRKPPPLEGAEAANVYVMNPSRASRSGLFPGLYLASDV
jgi:hypothetical protein